MAEERYHRQIILEGFGEQAQAKLLRAKVLVIGAGGLGCPALQYLAAAGVGCLGIADDDTVELSNLHRQILYTSNDIGDEKADVAAHRLSQMNSEIEIITHLVRIDRSNVLNIISKYDYVLDGSDNFNTRYVVNDACKLLEKPLIFAAVSGFEGQLAIFNMPGVDGTVTNYRDLFPVSPALGEIPNCEENGVLGVLPGIIGSMAAAETIKLITGIGKPLVNKLLHFNLLTNRQYEIDIIPGTGYICDDFSKEQASVVEIDADRLETLAKMSSTIVIDVREVSEYPQLNPEVFTQVPISVFDAYLHTDIRQKNIILLCQHGIRSVAAAEALHDKYGVTKNIYNLKGGIAKWRNYFQNYERKTD